MDNGSSHVPKATNGYDWDTPESRRRAAIGAAVGRRVG